MVISDRENDDRCLVVLSPLKWATLCWPLVWDVDKWWLCGEAGTSSQWVFLMDDNWTAHPVQFQWDNGVCLKPCGDEENIVKNALRHSRTMTFNDLLTVAHVKGLERPQRFSRKDLLTHLSQLFGSEPFIEELGSDAKIAKGNDDNLGLMGCIFENMDKSEQKDFDGIETKLRKSKDQEIKKRWADWTAEKKAEVKASHFHCVLLTSKLAVTEINCNCQCLTV